MMESMIRGLGSQARWSPNRSRVNGLRGLGISSHNQRQGQAVDEEGVIGVDADESRSPVQLGWIDVE
jgi:hypothetical protein